MELKVRKEITCRVNDKVRDSRQKNMSPEQTAEINCEKLLG